MKLSQIIKPDAIKVISSASSKKRLLQDVGDLAHSAYDLEQDLVVEALLDRESLGPTGVGHGVALPHARMKGIEQVSGIFLRLDKPVDFSSVDRQPVDIVFALFAPEEAGVEHLKALALVSRTLRDSTLCKKLRANADPATLHAILIAEQDMKAA